MHFGGASFLQQLHDALGRGTAHDGIVDNDHALAFDHAAHGGQLHAHALLAQFLRRLDEGSSHILVLDQAHLVWQTSFFRIAGGRGQRGIRHANDHIGIDRRFLGQTRTHTLAGGMHVYAVNVGIGACEVDEFHRADGQLGLIGVLHDLVAVIVDNHDFARANIAHQFGANNIERAGFGSEHISAVFHLAEGKRAETVRIKRADHGVFGHDQVGETAMHGVERFLELVHERTLCGAAQQVHQHFGVGIGVEDCAFVFQLTPQSRAVRQIAIVAQGHIAVMEAEDEWLDVVGAA